MPVSNSDYQGTIFRSPFFFYWLIPSFLCLLFRSAGAVLRGRCIRLGRIAGLPGPPAASVLGVPSAVAAASVPPPFVESAVAGGALDPLAPPSLAGPSVAPPRSQPRPSFQLLPLALLVATMPVPPQISWSGPRRLKYPLPLTYRILAPMSVFQRVKQLAVLPGPVLRIPWVS